VSRKKKIVYQSDFSLAKTGFGRAAKALLTYLYNTGKYDVVHYCCGVQYSNPELKKTPWKSIGSLPDNPQEIEQLNKDPNVARLASYGAHYLDKIIQEEKPDTYIAVQDIWGIDFAIDKKWFNKISCALWTTLDSLPILPTAVEKAPKIKNYWIWSDFATKALHDLGHKQVETVHGPVETSNFYRLEESQRRDLRNKYGIPLDAFIVGFVFRNQLRKSVPNLLEGYALWKRSNPQIKNTFLLLHTHWSEGWNIHKLAKEYDIDPREILTTYICKNCGNYEIKPFHGQDVDCRFCGSQKSQTTTNVGIGVTEEQLNEVYNLMDVYCHPFTSGGQEIPIQEAKLAELITLVTNYSCGEDSCSQESGGIALEWSEYREPGTQFIKASTCAKSICEKLTEVFFTHPDKKDKIGKMARQWVVDNFSVEVIGKKLEEIFDSFPDAKFDWDQEKTPDVNYPFPQVIDNADFIIDLYKNILKEDIDKNHAVCIDFLNHIKNGAQRQQIYNHIIQQAQQKLNKPKSIEFKDLLDQDDEGRRMAVVIQQSATDVLMINSLLENLKSLHPEYNLYIFTDPNYFDLIRDNPAVHKTLPYNALCENLPFLEGQFNHKGFFEIAFLPTVTTQKYPCYLHNGKNKIQFSLI